MKITWTEFISCKEEIVVGALYGFALIGFLGWWTILSTVLCALLWRLGGMAGGNKLFRRLGVPLTLCSLLVVSHEAAPLPSFVTGFLLFVVLSTGYGIPDARTGDEGSFLGRIAWFCTQDCLASNWMVRGFLGFFSTLCFLPAVTEFGPFGVMSTLLILVYPFIERRVR